MARLSRIADWPLPWKVLALLLVVSTVPLAAATGFMFRDAREQSRRDAERLLAARAEQTGGQIDAFHGLYLGLVERMGRSLTLREFVEGRGAAEQRLRMQASIDNIVDTDPHVQGVAIVGRDGVVVADTDGRAVGRDVGFRRYVADALAGRRGVTDPFLALAALGGEQILAYHGPLRREDGEVIAVVVVFVRASALRARLREPRDLAGPGSRAVLYDSVGLRIAQSAPGPVEIRPVGPLDPTVVEALVRDRRFGEETRAILLHPLDAPEERRRVFGTPDPAPFVQLDPVTGEKVLAVALRLQVAPWTLFTSVPLVAVERPSARLVGRSLAIGGILMAGALALGLLLSGWILGPVRPLTEALERVAAGDLAARVEIDRADALGRLGTGFNRMTEALAASRDELEHRVDERTRDLGDALRQLEEKNREVERATRLKTEFLANMSHELRTPLNSVIGFSDLLSEDLAGKLPDEQLRQLQEIHASGRYLLGLINDVLDLARIEAGRLSLDLEDVDVLVTARDAVRTLEPSARLRRIELSVDVRTERPVAADQRRLRQILLNLLSNAVKFSPPGGTVELVARDDGDDVRFEVRDHGPGIDAETVESIFQPFVQGESPLVKKHEGAGLGLAIVRSLVAEHGGSVGVETAPGRGATFWFNLRAGTLPGAPAGVAPPVSPPEEIAVADRPRRAPGRRLAVLAIDDDPNAGDLMRSTLEPEGYRVTWRDSGAAGLAAAFQQRPDLILVDLVLPDMTGFEVLDRLQSDPRSQGIPILVLTGAELSAPERDRIRGRVAALAEKGSLTRAALVDLVDGALDGRAPRRPSSEKVPAVLVVDDHDANRELARTLVERLGYRARVAPGAAEALDSVRREPPDLVLMDLAMPGLTGFAAARALKSDAATAAIPLVAFTALAMAPDRERAREAGFDDYLVKPVNRDALAVVLRRYLGETRG